MFGMFKRKAPEVATDLVKRTCRSACEAVANAKENYRAGSAQRCN